MRKDTDTERSLGLLPWSSVGELKLVFNVRVRVRKLYLTLDSVNSTTFALTWNESYSPTTCDDQGSHPDDLSVSVDHMNLSRQICVMNSHGVVVVINPSPAHKWLGKYVTRDGNYPAVWRKQSNITTQNLWDVNSHFPRWLEDGAGLITYTFISLKLYWIHFLNFFDIHIYHSGGIQVFRVIQSTLRVRSDKLQTDCDLLPSVVVR